MKTNNQRWWDIPAAIFLFLALFSASVRLATTEWTENLGIVQLLVVIGSILGFALAKSIFRGRTTFMMGLVYSLFVVPWQLGLMIQGYPNWDNRLYIVYARLYWATSDFIQNKPVHDPILFLTTMMLLFWFASLLSTYRLVRHGNPWLPLLSLGGMILVIEYTFELYKYTKISGGLYSAFYLFFCLLLMGRLYYLRSKKEWEQRGGTVEMEVGYDLSRGVAIVSIVVAFLAWQTPNVINFFSNDPSHERVSHEFQVFRDRISKAVNSLRSPNAVVVEGYGNSLALGTGGNQSTNLVFTATSDGGRPEGRMYWSARIYDTYSGGDLGWESTISDSRKIGPTERQIVYPSWQSRNNISFTFRSNVPLLKTLYFAGDPLNVSREAEAVISIAKDGSTDLNAIMIDPPLKGGESYIVNTSLAEPTVLSMRQSGADYPDWIKQRYLQIPPNFSPRVVALAKQIAGDEATPYDKAQAITQYLRRTITYTETVPEPPRGREPIEWFLFDQRAGFCNYYASSEVMMLRSLGVPARLAVGYAEGEYNAETGTYTVIGKDSHAWPEVYFPKLGWVTFEPTVSQPSSNYPIGEQSSQLNSTGSNVPQLEPTVDPMMMDLQGRMAKEREAEYGNRRTSITTTMVSPWPYVGIALIAIVGTLVFLERRRRQREDLPLPSWLERVLDERGFRTPEWLRMWSRRSLRTPMENLFANVALMLRVWGSNVEPAQTPAEQIALLVNVVPGVKNDAFTLLEEYQRAMYSPYPADTSRAKEAVSSIRSIGFRNWFMRMVGLESQS